MDIIELLTEFNVNVDFRTIIFLMAVGFCIKHIPVLEKVSNQIIPIVIIFFSLLIGGATLTEYTASAISDMMVSYIIMAAISIGFHQQGKSVFKNITSSIIDKYLGDKQDTKEDSFPTDEIDGKI